MGNGDIIMLPLSSLACKVGGKVEVPVADIFCGIEQSISEIAGAAFFHMSIGVIQFAILIVPE